MNPPKPHGLMAVPPTLHARMEIAKAVHALTTRHEDEGLRWRRAEISAIRSDLEELSQVLRKACSDWRALLQSELRKYNADEPRVPKGNPDGGQWTRVAAEDDPSKTSDVPSNEWVRFQKYGKGHHWVGRNVYKNFKLREDTRKVFENAYSGPLADPRANYYHGEHRAYDRAVAQAFRDFIAENKTTDEQVTPEQADLFWRQIRGSSDPIIGGHNRKIIREQLRYMRFFGLRGGGDEE